VTSSWNLLDGLTEADEPWTAVDEQGSEVTVSTPTLLATDPFAS